ncbi:hypothetical protein ES332_A07G045200v1 [Gossypium tomentosum]|uniref:Uncharacterized protein n=1 Tax=Gossypium tomentosum TaxID=34277 RepID=A0A5D2PNX2_GOSTO|nr:hypothetical protein ES332_A07G045200v1 [Gossypium tomentosum]
MRSQFYLSHLITINQDVSASTSSPLPYTRNEQCIKSQGPPNRTNLRDCSIYQPNHIHGTKRKAKGKFKSGPINVASI